MEYFAESPYWDPSSTTAFLLQKTQQNNQNIDIKSILESRTGYQYQIKHFPNGVVSIIAAYRVSRSEISHQHLYFLINHTFYQANAFETLLKTRLASLAVQTTQYLSQRFEEFSFDLASGFIDNQLSEQLFSALDQLEAEKDGQDSIFNSLNSLKTSTTSSPTVSSKLTK